VTLKFRHSDGTGNFLLSSVHTIRIRTNMNDSRHYICYTLNAVKTVIVILASSTTVQVSSFFSFLAMHWQVKKEKSSCRSVDHDQILSNLRNFRSRAMHSIWHGKRVSNINGNITNCIQRKIEAYCNIAKVEFLWPGQNQRNLELFNRRNLENCVRYQESPFILQSSPQSSTVVPTKTLSVQ
jgi:hypothetical protein